MTWVDDFAYLLSPVSVPGEQASDDTFRYASYLDIHTESHFPDLSDVKIVLLGVQDGRRSNEASMHRGADIIRNKFYSLFHHGPELKIADLGNIAQGNEPSDTDHAVKTVVKSLIDRNIAVIIIGGSQELTYSNYSAYEVLESTVNVALVDAKIDLGEFRDELSAENFLSKIVIHDPSYLFNLSVLGYQTYYNDPATIELLEKLFFDAHRLGILSGDVKKTEPLLRNADLVSFDICAIANESAPGSMQPNGFTGEEFCQMARYAGISDKTTSFGIYNYVPENDPTGQTAMLIAQGIWCILDGFSHRFREYPMMSKKNFIEYKVQMPDNADEISFYKSIRTDKWWVNVPYSGNATNRKFGRHHVVPCTYADYELACNGEVPDMWWRTYQKLG